jgi:hypothetical protein
MRSRETGSLGKIQVKQVFSDLGFLITLMAKIVINFAKFESICHKKVFLQGSIVDDGQCDHFWGS